MTDNSNNIVDTSGVTVNLFIRDISGEVTGTSDVSNNMIFIHSKNDIPSLDKCIEPSNKPLPDSASIINTIISFLDPDKGSKISGKKRCRSVVCCDQSMNKIQLGNKQKSSKSEKNIEKNIEKKVPIKSKVITYGLDKENHYNDKFWDVNTSMNADINDDINDYVITYEKVNIYAEIKSLADLLKLIKNNPLADNVEYNINMYALHNIEPELINLDAMIGMHGLKNHIVDQVIYYMQGFHKMGGVGDFMHTVIYGPPGTGKTEVAKIIGSIFKKLGVLSKHKFVKATRADLIAGYLGQTAIKTREVVNDALGGVLFIDEAYSLGNPEKRDSFAKECIDTLCEALSEHKNDLMVIIAGYEKELNTSFFSYNPGLNSRFTWRFKTDDYKPVELMEIFRKKVNETGWSLEQNAISEGWFKHNIAYFKYFGRDMETLFAKVKIAHSRRVFCLPKENKTKISSIDLNNGLMLFLENDEVKSRKPDNFISSMYL